MSLRPRAMGPEGGGILRAEGNGSGMMIIMIDRQAVKSPKS